MTIDEKKSERLKDVIDMLEPYQKIWDGLLDNTQVLYHKISLESSVFPSRSYQYRAGTSMRELGATRCLSSSKIVCGPAGTTEWAASIVFTPKKVGTYGYALITSISVQSFPGILSHCYALTNKLTRRAKRKCSSRWLRIAATFRSRFRRAIVTINLRRRFLERSNAQVCFLG